MPSTLVKNSLAVFASRLANGAAQLAVTLLLARALPVADFGRFAFGIAVGTLLAVVAESGTGLAMVRDIAADRRVAPAYFGTVLSVRLLASLAVLLIGGGVAWLAASPELAMATLLGIAIGLMRGLSRHPTALYYALERMHVETVLLVAEAVLVVGAVGAGVLAHLGLVALMLLMLAGYVLGFVLRIGAASRLLGVVAGPRWDRGVLGHVRVQALAYAVFALASAVFVQIDVPVATLVLGAAETGIYQAAAKIFVFLMLLPQGISNAFLPAASRVHEATERLETLTASVTFWLVGLALPIAVGGALLARPIMTLLYGGRYEAAGIVFLVLMVAVPLRFYTFVQGTVLTAVGRQGRRAAVMAVGSVVAVVGSVLGAWLAGVEGLAASRIVAEIVIVAGYAVGLGGRLELATLPARLVRLVPPTAALVAVVLVSPSLPVVAQIAVGALAYLAVGLAVGAVRPREIRALFGSAG